MDQNACSAPGHGEAPQTRSSNRGAAIKSVTGADPSIPRQPPSPVGGIRGATGRDFLGFTVDWDGAGPDFKGSSEAAKGAHAPRPPNTPPTPIIRLTVPFWREGAEKTVRRYVLTPDDLLLQSIVVGNPFPLLSTNTNNSPPSSNMRRSLALWPQLLAAASAIPWFGPAQTATLERVPQAPIITDAPILPRWFNGLSKRDAAPGICGWVEGFKENPYSCTGISTCLWNTDYHVIACGVPSSVAFQTQCVGYYDLEADCDVSCSYNPSINRCPATIPYCVNITLGGADVPYTAFACGSSSYSSYPEVQLTYVGETTLNFLPRYLEADGLISLGTQTPSGYTGPSANSSAAPSSTSSSPTSQTSSSQTSSESNTLHTQTPAPQVPSSSPTPSPSTSSSSNTGAIAGGVVGGVAGIAIIAGLIVYFIIRSRRKQREAGMAQNAQLAVQTENKSQFPGGPQSYPGSPAPAYPQPQGMYGQPGYVVPQQGYPQPGYYPQQQPGMNELSGTAAPSEMQVPHQQFPHQSFHELQ